MNYMAKVYADLVRKGAKTLEEIPKKIRDEVQQLLNQEEKASD